MKWKGRKETAKEARVREWLALPDAEKHFSGETAVSVAKLELRIEGRIVKPGDPDYDRDRKLDNPAFDVRPQLIAYCETAADVSHCLKFACEQGMTVTVRSGGHSTAGFSLGTGLVLDVSNLAFVVVDPVKDRALVGAGTRMGDLIAALDIYGLHVPAGGCHDVRASGFVQGGGYGYTSRMFGMNCDSLLEATVMLWNGAIVSATRRKNRDLFWALCGGTGGNFGILLQVTYQLRKLEEMTAFRIWWPLANEQDVSQAAEVLACIQKHFTGSEREATLGYQAFLTWQESDAGPGLPPKQMKGWFLLLRGMHKGTEKEFAHIVALLHKVAAPYQSMYLRGTYREIDQFIHLGPAVPQVDDAAAEDKQSAYIDRAIDARGWADVITRFLTGQPNNWSLLAIEPYGGAINRVARRSTAFIHRKADMNVYVDVFWMDPSQKPCVVRYLDEFMRFMDSKYCNGESYQNYPRESQVDYRQRYWGQSFATLRAIKLKYDEHDFFKFPQGVLPDPEHLDPPKTNDILPSLRAAIGAKIEYQLRAKR